MSSVPILDLPEEAVTKPTRLHLATLETVMLWPDDEDMRMAAMKLAIVEEGRNLMRQGGLTTSDVENLVHAAIESPRRQDLLKATEDAQVRGRVVGTLLYRAVAHDGRQPDQGKLGASIDLLSQRLWPKHRLRPATINNDVLKRFRCVSHFWAAFIGEALNGDTIFPCRVDALPRFLAIANEYRRLGETTRTPKSPRSFLLPGEAVKIPHAAILPTAELQFISAS